MQSWVFVQVFHLYDVEFWLVLSVESVGLPFDVMWGDCGEVRCCGLSMGWNSGDGWIPSGVVLVMLESAKDRVLGVDTPGQQVPPRVRYGTTCLLIRNTIGCVSCLVEWGWHHTLWSYFILCDLHEQHGVGRDICAGNLSTASGDRLFGKP
jgi:hypothetical protein